MVGLLAVVCSFLVIRLIDGFYGLSVYSLNVIFGLGLGLAIDYALFLVSRFREELGAGRDVHDAVRVAMATAGRTVVFSALTVAAAMLSLVVFPQQFLKSIGIGGAVVALVAASVALLILPALFTRMGTRLMPRGGVPNPAETRWARITATVLRRPGDDRGDHRRRRWSSWRSRRCARSGPASTPGSCPRRTRRASSTTGWRPTTRS